MRLRDYLLGRRIVLRTQQSRAKAIDRINDSAGSFFAPFRSGVAGGVYFGRVYLAWNTRYVSNGFRPIFSGRLVERGRTTELNASFGAPLVLRAFLALWYALLAYIAITTAISVMRGGIGARDPWAMLAVFPLFAIMPLAIHLIFNRKADAHCDAIIALLTREAGFVADDETPSPRR